MKRKPDPFQRTQPWKVFSVFHPIEQILAGIKRDGTIEVAGRQVVFKEHGRNGWYDAVAAIRGVIEFHQIAQDRYGILADTEPLAKFANKLDAGAPIFESDLESVALAITSCKRQAMALRVSQALDIVQTVQISAEFDKRKVA